MGGLSRNIAQRILGHIFAREIAEFACLSDCPSESLWVDGCSERASELSQTILGGSNFDFLPTSISFSRADWLAWHESSGWVDSQKSFDRGIETRYFCQFWSWSTSSEGVQQKVGSSTHKLSLSLDCHTPFTIKCLCAKWEWIQHFYCESLSAAAVRFVFP